MKMRYVQFKLFNVIHWGTYWFPNEMGEEKTSYPNNKHCLPPWGKKI